MPSQRLINDLPFGYYIAFLPLSICFSSLSMFITNTFPSLKTSPSRFFLFLTFFLLYRYIVLERGTQIEQTRQANDNKLMGQQLFFAEVNMLGGPAPVRRFLPDLIDRILKREINPGKVFTLRLPLEEAAEAYKAMDERRAIKVLLEP